MFEAMIGECAGQSYSVEKLKTTNKEDAILEIVTRFSKKMTCTGWAAVFNPDYKNGEPYCELGRTERDTILKLAKEIKEQKEKEEKIPKKVKQLQRLLDLHSAVCIFYRDDSHKSSRQWDQLEKIVNERNTIAMELGLNTSALGYATIDCFPEYK